VKHLREQIASRGGSPIKWSAAYLKRVRAQLATLRRRLRNLDQALAAKEAADGGAQSDGASSAPDARRQKDEMTRAVSRLQSISNALEAWEEEERLSLRAERERMQLK